MVYTQVAMASASQEALLHYCNALLTSKPTSSSDGGGIVSADDVLGRWEGRIGAQHGVAVHAALDVLVDSRLDALARFTKTIAMRVGGPLVFSDVDLCFERQDSSDSSAVEFSNVDKTVTSKVGSNTMAVCNMGFSVGKSTWVFRLDRDSNGGECSCFGAVVKPVADKGYTSCESDGQ